MQAVRAKTIANRHVKECKMRCGMKLLPGSSDSAVAIVLPSIHLTVDIRQAKGGDTCAGAGRAYLPEPRQPRSRPRQTWTALTPGRALP